MKPRRDWHVNSNDILDELEGCHPADWARTLALDLAECGQEVHDLRAEVAYLKAVIERLRRPGHG